MFNSKKLLLLLFTATVLTITYAFADDAKTESTSPKTDIKTESTPPKTDVKAAYPIDKCIVSDEKFSGEMGDPVYLNHNGREVKLCCKGCVKDFEKDPDKYLHKLDKAIAEAQKANYPLKTCVVSGEKLGEMGDPVEYVYQNQLVRFCCKGCISKFEKEPAKYLEKLSVTPATPETH